MLNISFNLSRVKYHMFSLFSTDVEDWFGYGKVNVLSYKFLMFKL